MSMFLNTLDGYRYAGEHQRLRPERLRLLRQPRGLPRRRRRDAAEPRRRRHGRQPAAAARARRRRPPGPAASTRCRSSRWPPRRSPRSASRHAGAARAQRGRLHRPGDRATAATRARAARSRSRPATGGTYEIVISRDGVDFDPGLPGNRALRGVVGPRACPRSTWDGKDNSGVAVPGQGRATRSRRCSGRASTTRRCSTWRARRTAARASPCSTRRQGVCPFTLRQARGATAPGVLRRPHLHRRARASGWATPTSGLAVPVVLGAASRAARSPTRRPASTAPAAARAFGDGAGANAN